MRLVLLVALVVGGCNYRIDPVDVVAADAGPSPAGDLASGAFLTLAAAPTPSTVDLTGEGTDDWAHWGYSSAFDFDHKATGFGQISNFQQVGVNIPAQYGDGLVTYSWSDGANGNGRHPNAGGTTTGLYVLTGGFALTAPADNTEVRRLRVYVGALEATGELDVSLSDNSAPVASDHSYTATDQPINVEYAITYRASAPGQLVRVLWSMRNSTGGNITLQSASLQGPVF